MKRHSNGRDRVPPTDAAASATAPRVRRVQLNWTAFTSQNVIQVLGKKKKQFINVEAV